MGEIVPVHGDHTGTSRLTAQETGAIPGDRGRPFYDMRAWQQSGVEDPVALGVINSPFSTTQLPTPASERPATE